MRVLAAVCIAVILVGCWLTWKAIPPPFEKIEIPVVPLLLMQKAQCRFDPPVGMATCNFEHPTEPGNLVIITSMSDAAAGLVLDISMYEVHGAEVVCTASGKECKYK